jgi:hypothetical protein
MGASYRRRNSATEAHARSPFIQSLQDIGAIIATHLSIRGRAYPIAVLSLLTLAELPMTAYAAVPG